MNTGNHFFLQAYHNIVFTIANFTFLSTAFNSVVSTVTGFLIFVSVFDLNVHQETLNKCVVIIIITNIRIFRYFRFLVNMTHLFEQGVKVHILILLHLC